MANDKVEATTAHELEALKESVKLLEKRVHQLETAQGVSRQLLDSTQTSLAQQATSDTDSTAVEDPELPQGIISFNGRVSFPDGENLQYEWTRPVDLLLTEIWDSAASKIAALAHPTRLAILKSVLESTPDQKITPQTLVERGLAGSTGSAYHHINALSQAGWLEKIPHSQIQVPPSRVVPLLALMLTGETDT